MHSSEVSMCANISIADEIKLYKQAGYDGVVLTNHYCPEWFESINATWDEKIKQYLFPYKQALKLCGDMAVILGMEIRFEENYNDYLVYGITEPFLLDHPKLYKLGIEKFHKLAVKNGLFVAQAHPFRPYMIPANPAFLDGVEAFNAHPWHDSQNSLALEFGIDHGLALLAGSDCHEVEHATNTYVLLPKKACNSKELAAVLKSGDIIIQLDRI